MKSKRNGRKSIYDDPAITSPELRNWYMEMIQTFPDMNGPFASEDEDNPYDSDYSIGVIRYQIPMLLNFTAPIPIKSPIVEPRCDG